MQDIPEIFSSQSSLRTSDRVMDMYSIDGVECKEECQFSRRRWNQHRLLPQEALFLNRLFEPVTHDSLQWCPLIIDEKMQLVNSTTATATATATSSATASGTDGRTKNVERWYDVACGSRLPVQYPTKAPPTRSFTRSRCASWSLVRRI